MTNTKIGIGFAESAELVSALTDGELRGESLAAAIDACVSQPDLLARWATYNQMGQVLRAPGAAPGATSPDFVARFSSRLMSEPAYSTAAPRVVPLPAASVSLAGPGQRPAANDSQFRWKLVAGFASVVAVIVVAWSTFGAAGPAAGTAPQLASVPMVVPPATNATVVAATPALTPEQVVVASPQGPMVRDARMEELMAAHKQIGATSAQMPSGFLRNATFESSQRSVGR